VITRQLTSAPVFVVGMNGSGTTMLLDCLGRHPELYAFPKETRLIPYLISRESAYGDLQIDANFQRLWDEVRTLAVFRESNDTAPIPLPPDWREYPRSLAGILEAIFGYFAAREGKRRWCEKTPQHVQHLLALSQQFPAAKFVHVIRDGRDCAVSFHRRWLRRPELTIFRWKKVVATGRDQGRQLGQDRYLEIRYEDLTAQPESSLRGICAFLGLPFAAATLDSAQPYLQSSGTDGARGLRANSGKWQGYFSARLQQRLERIAGRTLASCGYATQCPDCDANVPGWQRRYWSATEVLRQFAREIWRKLNGDLQRPWRVILAKPLNALRQRQHNEY
jgi:sulfotransferase family protein